jgi:protein ImuB
MLWIALQPLPEPDTCPEPLADPLLALGWWALQFTPRVARLDEQLLLEVSGSERLWGGRARLLRQISEGEKPVGHVLLGYGATSLIALARLHPGVSPQDATDALPLQTLAAAQPHLSTLQALGCQRWGDLRALPRAGVARRFGASLLQALDQAYGLAPETYAWLQLPEVFEARLELSASVESAPALLFGARRLLLQLQHWLRSSQRAVLALVLHWTLDARRHTAREGELVLRCAEPTQDMSHLQRLLAEQLAHITLPAPALWLTLRSLETQRHQPSNASLLPEEQRSGDSLTQTLERLCARLGNTQVLQWQALADHRPEHMQAWLPWQASPNAPQSIAKASIDTRARAENTPPDMALYPSWLLATPLPLQVRLTGGQEQVLCPDPLTLLAGPHRLEAAWWETGGGALRDYFIARSERSGLLWIYRERLSQSARWYLHGLYA